ncbi:MAG TPA: hypothetical protein VNB22_08010, partial [Pyrinomonadaceae bacterium]|nr:hypothetical protein [Pyrinomonadaceae bacterium]
MKHQIFTALCGALVFSVLFIFTFILKQNSVSDSQGAPVQSAAGNLDSNAVKTVVPAIDKIALDYGKLPINFEPNSGQTDERVKFLARGHGYSLFLTDREAVLALKKDKENQQAVVRMKIDGANLSPKVSGLGETASKTNYFIGNDPEKWQTGVSNYEKVKYESVYEGVDLVYYGSGQQLEYDFLVRPEADPNQIKLKFDGIKSAKIEETSGDLLLETGGGTLRQHKPVVYQNIDGER